MTLIPSEEVERVAAGLTKAQAEAISGAKSFCGNFWVQDNLLRSQVFFHLRAKEIVLGSGINLGRLTPLGLALRTYLERTAK